MVADKTITLDISGSDTAGASSSAATAATVPSNPSDQPKNPKKVKSTSSKKLNAKNEFVIKVEPDDDEQPPFKKLKYNNNQSDNEIVYIFD